MVSGLHWGLRTYPLWTRGDYCVHYHMQGRVLELTEFQDQHNL